MKSFTADDFTYVNRGDLLELVQTDGHITYARFEFLQGNCLFVQQRRSFCVPGRDDVCDGSNGYNVPMSGLCDVRVFRPYVQIGPGRLGSLFPEPHFNGRTLGADERNE